MFSMNEFLFSPRNFTIAVVAVQIVCLFGGSCRGTLVVVFGFLPHNFGGGGTYKCYFVIL